MGSHPFFDQFMSTDVWLNLARKLPVIRSSVHSVPPYHVGSVMENRLGLQVFRIVGKNIALLLRRRNVTPEIREYVETLDRDGVLVISNFLDREQFRNVLSEFESANAGVSPTPYKNVDNARLFRTQLDISAFPAQYPAIRANFKENPMLDSIVSAVIRRPITKRPEILLDTYQCLNAEGIDNDIENLLHADLHIPTIKMFFYLGRGDQNNGGFVYAKGSHKLTLSRLRHEYEMSVRQARSRRGLHVPAELQSRRGDQVRNVISPFHWRRMNLVETQICVEPNSLVIANNMGFHRRGEFLSDRPRQALLINYRNAEPNPFDAFRRSDL